MSEERTSLERLLRQERTLVVGALLLVIALSWVYLLSGAGTGMTATEMTRMSDAILPDLGGSGEEVDGGKWMFGQETAGMEMPGRGKSETTSGDPMSSDTMPRTPDIDMLGSGMSEMSIMQPVEWMPGYAVLMFLMWWIMMAAMMLPSASPMILLHATISRRNRGEREQGTMLLWLVMCFTLGYLMIWAVFSAIATSAQWGLEATGFLSSMMVSTSAALGAGLLIAAGIYQLTPLKEACLKRCRSPVSFITEHWRPGAGGAFRMGLEHGLFCLGCCWFLMLLLFYGGVMNLYWIIGIAAFVLLEKMIPAGRAFGKISGGVMIAWGVALLIAAGEQSVGF